MSNLDKIKKYYDELKTIRMIKVENKLEKILKIVFREKGFLKIEKYDCILNNGYTIRREKIVKKDKDGDAAIVFPITEDNKVILAIEPRVFTKLTVDMGFPAGYIEENEKEEASALRELEEETGYTTDNLIYLGKFGFYQDPGCSGGCNSYYLALNCRKVKEQKLDKDEFIKYILVDFDELEWLLENGYIRGLNSGYIYEKVMNYMYKLNNNYKNAVEIGYQKVKKNGKL